MLPIRRLLRPSRESLRAFSTSLNRRATTTAARPTVSASQASSTVRRVTSATSTTSKPSESSSTISKPAPTIPARPSAFGTVTKGKLNGLADSVHEDPITGESSQTPSDQIDWSKSYHGLSSAAFSPEVAKVLLTSIDPNDIEIKPDGILYLPEIKYRRILNKALGPGGWGLAPRGETIITENLVTREYALLAHGRLISVARGEQQFFAPQNIPTATEGCKSNALMRCCKDLGIASELWDPRFIRKFKKDYCITEFVEHVPTKKKKKLWRRKEDSWDYPYAVAKF